MAFVPRDKASCAPSYTDKYWILTSYGGYNQCIAGNGQTKYAIPNCVGYAWGRFMEILGQVPKLSKADAGKWYNYRVDGYERGSKPQLGAVACWSKPGGYGHVAIVEKINQDDSIVTSNSNYFGLSGNGDWFKINTLQPPNYSMDGLIFQGFIYNPACKGLEDKLSSFLDIAHRHVGESGDWTWKATGLAKNQPWCAAFIVACADVVGGLTNVIFPKTFSASEMIRQGVSKKMGTWLPGPHQGHLVTPQPGDLISFRWSRHDNQDTYFSEHIGIVKEVNSSKVNTIEGNSSNKVSFNQYALTSNVINGYYRPNWSAVGANILNLPTYGMAGPLYDMENTREDATLREVGYVNSANQPSIQMSNIKLSVVNYTSTLGALFELFQSSAPTQTVSVDGVSGNPRIILEYLMNKGLNAAAGVGIIANIKHESNFNTASKGDYRNGVPTSFGICQWHLGRGDNMKKMAGNDWETNLTGQLDYLWYELNTSYKNKVLIPLQDVPNTEAGAKKAADIFVRKFEVPNNVNSESTKRQNTASEYWKDIVVQLV